MKIDKNLLSEVILALANSVNESAAKLDLIRNRNFYNRLYEFSITLRTPHPEFANVVRIEKVEAFDYRIIQRVKIREQNCFLLGDAQAGLIIQKISENQDINSGKDGD